MELNKKILLINDLNELSKLNKKIHLQSSRIVLKIVIDTFTDEQNEHLTNKYNKYINSCGCREGAITGLFFILGYLGYYTVFTQSIFNGWFFLKILGMYILGASIGKILTLSVQKFLIIKTYNSFIN